MLNKYFIASLLLIGAVLINTTLYAQNRPISSQNIQTPFDVNEVIGRVSRTREARENIENRRQNIADWKQEVRSKRQEIRSRRQELRDRKMRKAEYGQRLSDNGERLLKSGEFLIDTSITYIPAPGNQHYSAVAFDGTNYLVVWQDQRRGFSDIYGARVSQAGERLDPSGILISTAVAWYRYQEHPAVSFDGANWLVVWQDQRSSSYSDIYGARVSQAGTVLDPTGIPISTAARYQEHPTVSFDGTNYFVVWTDDRSDPYEYDIYGARVTPGGTVLDPSGIPISTAADDQYRPAVSFDGTNFLVVWEDNRSSYHDDIYGARVTPGGNVLDPDGIAISTAASWQEYPAISFDGTNFLVVWDDTRNPAYDDIYGARVSQTGTVLDPDGIAISTARSSQREPAVSFDGTNFLVVWEDKRSLSSYDDIYGARVTPAGNVLDPDGIPISTAARYHEHPAVSFDGTNWFVVWTDDRTDPYEYNIYGARVTPGGIVLDPDGIPISSVAYDQEYPAVSFDGTNYLVVWMDFRSGPDTCDIYGARVSQAGTVLEPAGIPISIAVNFQRYPAVSFDGTNWLVVWEDRRSGAWDIYGTRVSQAGTVLEPGGIPISTSSYSQWYPAVSFDGTNFLVVWVDDRSGSYSDIYGARVTSSGAVLDPTGIAISTAANYQLEPAVSFDGTNFLVVWEDKRSGSYSDIYGARVTSSGAVLDPTGIAISTAANYQLEPAVSFDGANWLVVWQDQRSGSYSDIYGARVTPAGVVFDSGPVVRQEGSQQYPALARGSGSQMFLVYQGWTGTVGGTTYNADRIWGKFYPFIGIEENRQMLSTDRFSLNAEPNPFKSQTTIRYSLPTKGKVSLSVYDVSGRTVKTLVNESKGPGVYSVNWNGADDDGKRVSQGVYFYVLKIDNQKMQKKMLMLK